MIYPYFRVETLSATPNPQTAIWFAKQDYCEDAIADKPCPTEEEAGLWVVEALCKKKHLGPLEHPQIQFNVIGFPHSTMVQFRTHRCGISFDVQSGRYTGKRVLDASVGRREIEELFYFRPLGEYSDRQGTNYLYTQEWRRMHIDQCRTAIAQYALDIRNGMSEEHSRDNLPYNIRQNFVMSCNLRTVLHLFAMRSSKEAQLECQILCDLLLAKCMEWAPEVIGWYKEKHYGKAFIAP